MENDATDDVTLVCVSLATAENEAGGPNGHLSEAHAAVY